MQHVPAIQVSSDGLPRTPTDDLAHLPGPRGHWYFGNVRELFPDLTSFLIDMRAEHGDCFTVGVLRNRRVVVLAGPAANRLVLLDAGRNFSSRLGWEAILDFFNGFVLLRDFEAHAFHRELLRPFFKAEALQRPARSQSAARRVSCRRAETPHRRGARPIQSPVTLYGLERPSTQRRGCRGPCIRHVLRRPRDDGQRHVADDVLTGTASGVAGTIAHRDRRP
ncbi:MAG: cytochrome P450 [Gammaproteobacteria bacterium]|nr:cytochrome P450 [Gammaproteobacteria bacterium]